jgi:hypothetical protein
MPAETELKFESFFASRSGVCVYVNVGKRAFRVQFATPDAIGVVVEGGSDGDGAKEARHLAAAALRRHASALAPLFAKVAKAIT